MNLTHLHDKKKRRCVIALARSTKEQNTKNSYPEPYPNNYQKRLKRTGSVTNARVPISIQILHYIVYREK